MKSTKDPEPNLPPLYECEPQARVQEVVLDQFAGHHLEEWVTRIVRIVEIIYQEAIFNAMGDVTRERAIEAGYQHGNRDGERFPDQIDLALASQLPTTMEDAFNKFSHELDLVPPQFLTEARVGKSREEIEAWLTEHNLR